MDRRIIGSIRQQIAILASGRLCRGSDLILHAIECTTSLHSNIATVCCSVASPLTPEGCYRSRIDKNQLFTIPYRLR